MFEAFIIAGFNFCSSRDREIFPHFHISRKPRGKLSLLSPTFGEYRILIFIVLITNNCSNCSSSFRCFPLQVLAHYNANVELTRGVGDGKTRNRMICSGDLKSFL